MDRSRQGSDSRVGVGGGWVGAGEEPPRGVGTPIQESRTPARRLVLCRTCRGWFVSSPPFLIDIYCGEEVVVLIKGCDGCRKSGD